GVGRDADVERSVCEDGGGAPEGMRDPGGEAVVVSWGRFVEPLERPVEVLSVKEDADLHGQLPGKSPVDNVATAASPPRPTTFECRKATRQRPPMQGGVHLSARRPCSRAGA